MGSYTGNGSNDGTFVYTGFRIKWLLIKNITSARYWRVWDIERDPYNLSQNALSPDANLAEYVTNNQIDILSNGFKLRTSNDQNVNGHNHIYMAFAENPFKTARAR